jgi:3-deoxy-7-phosphoheptulonate synthase
VHFELTADDVTECTGGLVTVRDNDLPEKYETYCDPRLNYSQSMEMAFLLSRLLKQHQNKTAS